MRLQLATCIVAAAVFLAATPATPNAGTYTYDHIGVDAVLDQTPQIETVSPQPPGEKRYTYYRLKGTRIAGYVVPAEVQAGELLGNRHVLVVPLESLGTGGSFAALVWIESTGDWKYAGYIPSPNGDLRWWIEAGYVQVLTPTYKPSDANCCPSAHRQTRYTVSGGKLVSMSSRTIARGERFPQWMYIVPGARAFLGTDGEDAPVAIVCGRPGKVNDSCTGRDEGTPIVIDGIVPSGKPCTNETSLKVHAANGSWKGYVGINAVQAPIPAGTLLELNTSRQPEMSEMFGVQRNVDKDPGRAIDATLRVIRFDPKTNDPSGSTRDTFVTVTSGSRAGSQGWVFASATTLKEFWVPPNLVCESDDRALSLR